MNVYCVRKANMHIRSFNFDYWPFLHFNYTEQPVKKANSHIRRFNTSNIIFAILSQAVSMETVSSTDMPLLHNDSS